MRFSDILMLSHKRERVVSVYILPAFAPSKNNFIFDLNAFYGLKRIPRFHSMTYALEIPACSDRDRWSGFFVL